ncbi:MAG: tyrosinase family protein [Byssovorax sp.]
MAVELQINNSSSASARYVGYAPAQCRIRYAPAPLPPKVPVPLPFKVKLVSGGPVGQVVFYGTGATPSATAATSLTVTLPPKGKWASFWMGGAFGSPSVDDGDASVRVMPLPLKPFPARPKPLLVVKLMVRVRKNANALTAGERDRFLVALGALNNNGAGLFQTFRDMHVNASIQEAHGGPQFLPWHRSYLLDLERELQNIDRSVTLPYWRFDQAAPNLFTSDFIGRTSMTASAVTFSATNPLQLWQTDSVSGVVRRSRFDTTTSAAFVIDEASTLGLGTNYPSFRTMEGNPHGSAHTSFTGWISSIDTAAKDPLFFLLHCNVDRLWAKWQWLGAHFDPAVTGNYDSAAATRIGWALGDTMWPWNGVTASPRPTTAPGGGLATSACVAAPGTAPVVSSQLDFQGRVATGARLGFDYDDVPYP